MIEEKSIDLTDDEILMIRSFCQDTLASEPQNAELATSILAKLIGVESSEIPIREQLTLKKRGRPRRISSDMPKEVLVIPEPEPIEVTAETPAQIDEQVQEPQLLVVLDNSELTQTVAEQSVTTVASNQKLNFLQHLLQKLRPAVRP